MTSAIQANIKKQLHAKNMSAAELERRTGIPHAVINILHGRSKNPSLRTAQAIAKELGCSVEELFREDGVSTQLPAINSNWHPELYLAATQAVLSQIQELALNPEATQVGSCITEVYTYSLGSPTQTVDQRFVQWLLNKSFAKPV